jgi:hypothetical protein
MLAPGSGLLRTGLAGSAILGPWDIGERHE